MNYNYDTPMYKLLVDGYNEMNNLPKAKHAFFKANGNSSIQGMQANLIMIDDFANSQPVTCPPLPNKELCKVINPDGNIVEYVWKTKQEQEGNKPMAYNKYSDATAVATVQAQPSDEQIQRQYLLTRLGSDYLPYYDKRNVALKKQFNIDVDNQPKTYKDLIDAIKNDKFKLDEKRIKRAEEDSSDDEDDFSDSFYGPFDGIVFDGPEADLKGYNAALAEWHKRYTDTKDAIMVFSAEEGLKALKAFETWTPGTDATAS